MFSIIGILVVFGAVLGGFLMEKGPVAVLMQPSEFLIIGGAGDGNIAGCQSSACAEESDRRAADVLKGSKFSRQRYVDTLKMMFLLFNKARKGGLVGIESDVEEPEKSTVFSKYPRLSR